MKCWGGAIHYWPIIAQSEILPASVTPFPPKWGAGAGAELVQPTNLFRTSLIFHGLEPRLTTSRCLNWINESTKWYLLHFILNYTYLFTHWKLACTLFSRARSETPQFKRWLVWSDCSMINTDQNIMIDNFLKWIKSFFIAAHSFDYWIKKFYMQILLCLCLCIGNSLSECKSIVVECSCEQYVRFRFPWTHSTLSSHFRQISQTRWLLQQVKVMYSTLACCSLLIGLFLSWSIDFMVS